MATKTPKPATRRGTSLGEMMKGPVMAEKGLIARRMYMRGLEKETKKALLTIPKEHRGRAELLVNRLPGRTAAERVAVMGYLGEHPELLKDEFAMSVAETHGVRLMKLPILFNKIAEARKIIGSDRLGTLGIRGEVNAANVGDKLVAAARQERLLRDWNVSGKTAARAFGGKTGYYGDYTFEEPIEDIAKRFGQQREAAITAAALTGEKPPKGYGPDFKHLTRLIRGGLTHDDAMPTKLSAIKAVEHVPELAGLLVKAFARPRERKNIYTPYLEDYGRGAAMRVLFRINPEKYQPLIQKEATRALQEAIRTGPTRDTTATWHVRQAAIDVLGPRDLDYAMKVAIKDPDWIVRQRAYGVLAAHGGPEHLRFFDERIVKENDTIQQQLVGLRKALVNRMSTFKEAGEGI